MTPEAQKSASPSRQSRRLGKAAPVAKRLRSPNTRPLAGDNRGNPSPLASAGIGVLVLLAATSWVAGQAMGANTSPHTPVAPQRRASPPPAQFALASALFSVVPHGPILVAPLRRQPIEIAQGPQRHLTAILFPDRLLVLGGGQAREVKLPGTAVPQLLNLALDSPLLAWSPAGDRLYVNVRAKGCGTTVALVSAHNPAPRAEALPAACGALALGWSSDGRQLLLSLPPNSSARCFPGQSGCATRDLAAWRDGVIRPLVNARDLTSAGEGDPWLIRWDSPSERLFLVARAGFDGMALFCRSARTGKQLWRVDADYQQLVAPGLFGVALRGWDSATESIAHIPALVDPNGGIVRRYPAAPGDIFEHNAAWAPGADLIAQIATLPTNNGSLTEVIVRGKDGATWRWSLPRAQSLCEFFWQGTDSLHLWTGEIRGSRSVSRLWLLTPATQQAHLLLEFSVPFRPPGAPSCNQGVTLASSPSSQ